MVTFADWKKRIVDKCDSQQEHKAKKKAVNAGFNECWYELANFDNLSIAA